MHKIYKETHPTTGDPMWLIAYRDINEEDRETGLKAVSGFINVNPFPAKGITLVNSSAKEVERTDIECSLMDIPDVIKDLSGMQPEIKAISWNSLTCKYVAAVAFSGELLKAGAEYKYDRDSRSYSGYSDIREIKDLLERAYKEPEPEEDLVDLDKEIASAEEQPFNPALAQETPESGPVIQEAAESVIEEPMAKPIMAVPVEEESPVEAASPVEETPIIEIPSEEELLTTEDIISASREEASPLVNTDELVQILSVTPEVPAQEGALNA